MAITSTQAGIEAIFGQEFVSQWSSYQQGRNAAVNGARMTQAIALGTSYVNGRLGNGQYQIPLTANDVNNPPPEIVDAMDTYAGWWLWKTRGLNYAKDTIKWMTDLKTNMDRQLIAIRVGSYPIDAVLNMGRRQTPEVINCR